VLQSIRLAVSSLIQPMRPDLTPEACNHRARRTDLVPAIIQRRTLFYIDYPLKPNGEAARCMLCIVARADFLSLVSRGNRQCQDEVYLQAINVPERCAKHWY